MIIHVCFDLSNRDRRNIARRIFVAGAAPGIGCVEFIQSAVDAALNRLEDDRDHMGRLITKRQALAIQKRFESSPDGAASYLAFRRRWKNHGDFIGANWCGMFVGIEKDGHSHT